MLCFFSRSTIVMAASGLALSCLLGPGQALALCSVSSTNNTFPGYLKGVAARNEPDPWGAAYADYNSAFSLAVSASCQRTCGGGPNYSYVIPTPRADDLDPVVVYYKWHSDIEGHFTAYCN